MYYLFEAFIKAIKVLNKNSAKEQCLKALCKPIKYLKTVDFITLIAVFVVENAFSTLIFFNQFTNAYLFIFSNFIFHYLFFTIGFDLGSKIAKKIASNTPIITGTIFILLGLFEFFR